MMDKIHDVSDKIEDSSDKRGATVVLLGNIVFAFMMLDSSQAGSICGLWE